MDDIDWKVVTVLADSAYWLTHDHRSGGLRTSARSAAFIVTASVVGELVLDGSVRVRGGRVLPGSPSPDPLGRSVGRQIAEQPGRHGLAFWLERLACGMRRRVRARMVLAGTAEPHRVGLLRPPLVVARVGDPWPGLVYRGLAAAVAGRERLDGTQRFLLRMAQHTSLSRALFRGADPASVEHAIDQTADLWPPWQTVLEAALRAPALHSCQCRFVTKGLT